MFKSLIRTIIKQFTHKKSSQQLAYHQLRLQMLKNFKYQQFQPTISLKQFVEKYSDKKQLDIKKTEIISGRVSSIRKHGKTTFVDLRQQHIKLQVALTNIIIDDQSTFPIRRGDIIGVQGQPFYTKKGQLSITPESIDNVKMIAPCLWMLPEYGLLKDNQIRHRNKHIDLITNSQSMKVLKLRSKILRQLRMELQIQGFIEVETPILSLSCGGAIAPFVTYHNQHKMNLYMRIAPELYLKQLLVGDIQKVFQIGKNFRNQSIDQTHNPQFTSCQLYVAYSNYKKMMKFTKQLIINLAKRTIGGTKIKVQGRQIQLDQQWKIIQFIKGLQNQMNIKFPTQFQTNQSLQFLKSECEKHSIACDEPRTASRLLDKLVSHFLQPYSLTQPLIIINHPRVLSPLARPLNLKPHLTERFELFIGGWQIVNSYTELNDPSIQLQNTPQDEQFVEVLQYGLMPCAGWGMGIDRLIMLFSKCERIQDVIIFPLLKDTQKYISIYKK